MSNFILAFIGTMLTTIVVLFISYSIVFLPGKLYKAKEKKARIEQHLMFNQLKKGNYIWKVYKGEITTFIVTLVKPIFNDENECKGFYIYSKNIDCEYLEMGISVDLNESKSFNYNCYYTLFGEADITAKAVKSKMDKESLKASSYTMDDIIKASEEVKERLEKIIKNNN